MVPSIFIRNQGPNLEIIIREKAHAISGQKRRIAIGISINLPNAGTKRRGVLTVNGNSHTLNTNPFRKPVCAGTNPLL